jgi:hypothetical protein
LYFYAVKTSIEISQKRVRSTIKIRSVGFQKLGVCFEENAIFCGSDDSVPGECTNLAKLALTRKRAGSILEEEEVFGHKLLCCCNTGLIFGLEADV